MSGVCSPLWQATNLHFTGAFRAHSEHRYPLPRLIYLGLFRVFGDLRAGMVVSAILLSASAAGLIVAARRARGRSSLVDLVFPLIFLNGGHWENLLMSYQLAFTIPTALGVVLAFLAAGRKSGTISGPQRLTGSALTGQGHATVARLECGPLAPRADASPQKRLNGHRQRSEPPAERAVHTSLPGWRIALVALVSILLTGCGAAGLCLALAGAGWLGLISPRLIRSKSWGNLAIAGTGALTVLAVIGLTVATFPHTNAGNPFAKPIDLLRFAARLAAVSFGPATDWLWPVKAAIVSLGGVIGLGVACHGWKAGDRFRLAGLGAVLLGTTALIAGVTWGRAWAGPEAAAASRYSTLLLPGVGATFLLATASGTRLGRGVQVGFAALALVAWPTSANLGIEQGTRLATFADSLATDLRDGVPIELINERYDWQLFLKSPDIPTAFEIASRLQLQTFREIGPPRVTHSIPLPTTADTRTVVLPATSCPLAVRICGEFAPRVNTLADFQVRWQQGNNGPWHEQRFQMPRCFPFTAVIRVTEEAQRIEIVPDGGSSDFRLTSVNLIVDQAPRRQAGQRTPT